jgi:hypothetical protein
MQTLTKRVLEHAAGLPEGTPLAAKELLHLGSRAAVDQVLSRLVRRGILLRAFGRQYDRGPGEPACTITAGTATIAE